MKKKIIIFCAILATLSLTAFGVISKQNTKVTAEVTDQKSPITQQPVVEQPVVNVKTPDFFYNLGTRFHGVKKSTLSTATSFADFLTEDATKDIVSYQSVSIILFKNEKRSDISETGSSGLLTIAQQNLLHSFDYSTNFVIQANFKERDIATNTIVDSYATPHLTIVPEKQAEYDGGKKAFIDYLKANNSHNTLYIDSNKLKSAKLFFTVSKTGKITNTRIESSCGYPAIDDAMLEFLTKAPGKWHPAENVQGEKVDQELVISFGQMGC